MHTTASIWQKIKLILVGFNLLGYDNGSESFQYGSEIRWWPCSANRTPIIMTWTLQRGEGTEAALRDCNWPTTGARVARSATAYDI